MTVRALARGELPQHHGGEGVLMQDVTEIRADQRGHVGETVEHLQQSGTDVPGGTGRGG